MLKRLLAILAFSLALASANAASIETTFDPSTSDDRPDGFKVGDLWRNTLTGNNFVAISVTPGSVIWRHIPRVLASSATAATGAADTAENTYATITVPAYALGANGTLRTWLRFTYTNSANNKTMRVRYSGAAGTVTWGPTRTTQLGSTTTVTIQNRTLTSQIYSSVSNNDASTADGNAGGTISVDTSAATTIVITGQKATGGETLTLEGYTVELIRPDIQ